MGSLDFEPLHPDFGAKVRGVSLVGEIADETVEEIKKAIDNFSLLCFPEQLMNDARDRRQCLKGSCGSIPRHYLDP